MSRRKRKTKISNAVIKRLPRYRRYLLELMKKGQTKISSSEFSEMIGYTASQIRQDLNNFGEFGQQGYGYNVEQLCKAISGILGLDQKYKMVIAGAGNLGSAIAHHTYYYQQGFVVKAIFDVKSDLFGKTLNDVTILDVEEMVEYIEKNKIDIGIICAPKEGAQAVADKMCFAGVRGIWNFAPVDIEVPNHVSVEHVHLSDSLHSLAYHMTMSK